MFSVLSIVFCCLLFRYLIRLIILFDLRFLIVLVSLDGFRSLIIFLWILLFSLDRVLLLILFGYKLISLCCLCGEICFRRLVILVGWSGLRVVFSVFVVFILISLRILLKMCFVMLMVFFLMFCCRLFIIFFVFVVKIVN